jgi:hypothetical protein
MQRITIVCFLASYLTALALELWHLFRPRPVLRLLGLGFGMAGLVAQTLYLAVQKPHLAWQFGFMLLLAWILAIFYLYGSLHHGRLAWGVFVLPVVLGLVVLGGLATWINPPPPDAPRFYLHKQLSLPAVHATLLVLATVGLCVGFVASLMYLFQAHRLRAKVPPGQGLRLLSLERLEAMNRRAIYLAFPLLTLGMLLGAVLMFAEGIPGWGDPRVLATLVLWVTFAVLFYLRFSDQVRGRYSALLTILTFVLLLGCLTLSHPVGQAGASPRLTAGPTQEEGDEP